MKAGWDYKELYLAVLEELAKKLRLKRFYIYTVEEMVKEVSITPIFNSLVHPA
mgnify:CR=1 FL=1